MISRRGVSLKEVEALHRLASRTSAYFPLGRLSGAPTGTLSLFPSPPPCEPRTPLFDEGLIAPVHPGGVLLDLSGPVQLCLGQAALPSVSAA